MAFGQVDLAHISCNYGFGAKADAGEEHFHLLRRGVLCFVENDEGVVQGAPAHKGKGGDFKGGAFECFLYLLEAHKLVERVVQGAQVGVDFLHQVTRQKAQSLACFYCGAGEHNALHSATLKGIYSAGYSKPGFACACRAYAKGDVVAGYALQVHALGGGARAQVAAAGGKLGIFGGQGRIITRGEHELHGGRLDGAGSLLVQGLQHFQGAVGAGFGSVDFELLVAVGDFYV